ncbi:hypothetical protein DFJ58DRAFT_782421 [Suillus subalutaceus]|uniref:uncharacterized protein n=1 Tax=Suillus subalutaceus TaxID=48586 RepID=UPI001B8638BB|nr:uncharacterized protein DFJ58DRAFT_782421 [Suillus subalutaceus]KAG1858015.1 hypothetical protein DFJ58DRAFT_782421 [Suillus subalutaceus]
MDFSIYTEFVVIFGWDLESLWQTIHKYKCLILFRARNIGALECYRSLLEPCDEAQKAILIAWFAEEAETQSATEAWARENTEDEAIKVSSESKVAEANAKKKNAEDEAKKASSERKLTERTAERSTEVGSAADDKTQKNIKKADRRLPKDRRCSRGYAWVPTSTVVFLLLFFFCTRFYPLKDIPYVGHSLMGPLVSRFASLELQMPWCEACPHQSVVPASPSTCFKCTGVGHSIYSEQLPKLDASDGSDDHHRYQRIAYEIMLDYC